MVLRPRGVGGVQRAAPGLLSAAVPASPLLTSLVAYWTLNEAGGTRADATGRGNDLSENSASLGATTGKQGQAALYTTTDRWLTRTSTADLRGGDVDFTMAGWFNVTSAAVGHDLAGKWGSGSDEYVLFQNGGGAFVLNVKDGAGSLAECHALAFGNVPSATWCFVVWWHDAAANTLNIQVNGGTVNTVEMGGGLLSGNGAFALGVVPEFSENHLVGAIDEVGIWKRVLTDDERATL
jgi:Concanavalin A-like lectin/glucanases superfamily